MWLWLPASPTEVISSLIPALKIGPAAARWVSDAFVVDISVADPSGNHVCAWNGRLPRTTPENKARIENEARVENEVHTKALLSDNAMDPQNRKDNTVSIKTNDENEAVVGYEI